MIFSNLGPTVTKGLVAVALTLGSTVTAAPAFAACQPGQPGCVLPIADVPPPVADAAPPPVGETAVAEAAGGGGGIGLIPILVALGLAGLAAYFLFIRDDDEEPITP
jgi:hypothetical protein